MLSCKIACEERKKIVSRQTLKRRRDALLCRWPVYKEMLSGVATLCGAGAPGTAEVVLA